MFLFGGAANSSPLEDGAKIPNLSLPSFTGKKISLASYAAAQKKRNLLLVFFRTGTCGVCTHQLVELSKAYAQISDWNTAVLALSVDDAIIHAGTSEKIQKRFPLLLDPDAKAIKAFGVFNETEKKAWPSIYLVGPDRKVLYHYVGKDMMDRPKTETVLEAIQHHSGLAARKGASLK